MLCLTVYEAKGLEFDDVILFNSFAMGDIKTALWKLIEHVREEKSYRKELPDWIMDIGEGEEEAFVEAGVAEALEKYQAEKAQRLEEEKKLEAEQEAKRKAEADAAGDNADR